MDYDYIIIGSNPCGLTLAYYLSKMNKTVLLVDGNQSMNYNKKIDEFNKEINSWCQENICDTMYWAFQIVSNDLPMHRDLGTKIKLTYILQTGGKDTVTEWYNDKEELVESVALEPFRWHIFKADSYHAVKNITPGQQRFSVTGRVFP